MGVMPDEIKHSYLRGRVRVSYESPPQLSFRIAQTQEELEQAYRILHDCYVEQRFMLPSPTGLRITKYFAMPTTTTLIACWNNEVVGTMSIIRKSPLGLPMEQAFKIGKVEEGGYSVAEVSSLAIDKKFRSHRGSLFLPLCRYFYRYVRDSMKIDRAVIAVDPAWRDFYMGILGFRDLEKRVVDNYDFANGAPAIGLWLDIPSLALQFFKAKYNHREDRYNLYKYFVEVPVPEAHFPDRRFIKVGDPVMTPKMLDYFFNQRSQVFSELSENEILGLASVYAGSEYAKVLPQFGEHLRFKDMARYSVQTLAQRPEALDQGAFKVLDVSRRGLRAYGKAEVGQQVSLQVRVSETEEATVHGVVRWKDEGSKFFGLELTDHNEVWAKYLDYLDADFEGLLDSKEELKKAG